MEDACRGGEAIQISKSRGTHAFESEDGAFLYFAKQTRSHQAVPGRVMRIPAGGPAGIWRIPIDGGEEAQILEKVGWGDWTPTDKGIYFSNREAEPGPTIELFDFASEEVSHVAVLEHPPLNNWLSVSPDEKWILYVRSEQTESDIMLVENFR